MNSTTDHGYISVPASEHPEVYSVNGSHNGLTTGRLTVLAGETIGWNLISFTGAEVEEVKIVDGVHGIELSGEWDQAAQTWTLEVPPEDLAQGEPDLLTRNQSWTVVIHVAPNWEVGGHAMWGNEDDVDAHFECVGCVISPPSPPPPHPTPPPHPVPPPPHAAAAAAALLGLVRRHSARPRALPAQDVRGAAAARQVRRAAREGRRG